MDFSKNIDKVKAVIFSIEGSALTANEKSLFAQSNPLGFILFARNCETPAQVRALTDDLRDTLGRDCPILIDQEGGRVQRLKPPHWNNYPPMKTFGDQAVHDLDGAILNLQKTIAIMAGELKACGINVNCAPVLDVLTPATHDAIGDRAFSDNARIVSKLSVNACNAFLNVGITPVIKHIPGHGRATQDSHKALPHVNAPRKDLENDFTPFKTIAAAPTAPAIWGMAAHIVYDKIDADYASSVSPTIINEIIRGEIGFDGLLLSDDLDMDALNQYGNVAERALKTLEAGCDVALYCSGTFSDMQKIAESVPNLSDKAQKRLQSAAKFPKLVG